MKTIQKPVGIWLDFRDAFIVYLNNGSEKTLKVQSEIDESNPVGGSGSSTPYGAQEAVSETRYLHRRQQQEKQYFQSIIDKLADRDAVYIMGPAQAKIHLEQELKKQPNSAIKIIKVESCDRLTENQIRARIRDHFREL